MIIEIELAALAAIAAVQARILVTLTKQMHAKCTDMHASKQEPFRQDEAVFPSEPNTQTVEIVKRRGDDWVHVGHRHAQHADVYEALATPGLALRHSDGRIETICL